VELDEAAADSVRAEELPVEAGPEAEFAEGDQKVEAEQASDDLGPRRPDFVRVIVDGVPVPEEGPRTKVVPAAEQTAPKARRRAGGRPTAPVGGVLEEGLVPVGGAAGPVTVPARTSPSGPKPTTPEPVLPVGPRRAGQGIETEAAQPETAVAAAPAKARPSGPRRVKLQVARVSPWSVMKMAFLLSVALGVAFVVMVYIVWNVLDRSELFVTLNNNIAGIVGPEAADRFDILQYVDRGKVMAGAAGIAVIDVALATILATLGALIYNITSALVGGIHVTLRDD
jgi:hypothetical protein